MQCLDQVRPYNHHHHQCHYQCLDQVRPHLLLCDNRPLDLLAGDVPQEPRKWNLKMSQRKTSLFLRFNAGSSVLSATPVIRYLALESRFSRSPPTRTPTITTTMTTRSSSKPKRPLRGALNIVSTTTPIVSCAVSGDYYDYNHQNISNDDDDYNNYDDSYCLVCCVRWIMCCTCS